MAQLLLRCVPGQLVLNVLPPVAVVRAVLARWLGSQVKKVKKRPAEGEAASGAAPTRNPFQVKLDAKKAHAKRVRFSN
jgi:hypothetical protein